MEMVKVYGVSDDLVIIEGSAYKEDEIDCFGKDVRIRFLDGTVIRIGYPKHDAAIWWIDIERKGTAAQRLDVCNDEDAQIYSDVFCIDSEIESNSVIKRR